MSFILSSGNFEFSELSEKIGESVAVPQKSLVIKVVVIKLKVYYDHIMSI